MTILDEETLVWHSPDAPPDVDTTVVVYVPDEDEPVWLGYYLGDDGWCAVDGGDFEEGAVKAWAAMPVGDANSGDPNNGLPSPRRFPPMPRAIASTMHALQDVADERSRQVSAEAYDRAHDDEHKAGELAQAAACYAAHAGGMPEAGYGYAPYWPFDDESWKPKDPRRDLIRAAALIVAEIERLDRAAK